MVSVPTSLSQTLMTGVYRSGTEWFTMLMSGHPELASTMYHVNAMRWALDLYDPLDAGDNLERAVRDTAERIRDRYKIEVDVSRAVAAVRERGKPTYGALYDVLMSMLWLGGEKRHWMEKNQLVWREIPAFLEAVPNGRAVMVVRDPRSVLASTRKWTIAAPPAYLGAVFNCLDALRHAKRYAETLPADRFLVVRYEDAAHAPVEAAHRVLRFLGLDPDRFVHDPGRWQGAYGEQWKVNSSFADTSKPFDIAASVQRWKALEPVDLAFCEHVCGPLMAEFGYQATGQALDWPELLRKLLLDPVLTDWLRGFLAAGEGVQCFPLDPLKRENWSEGKTPATKVGQESR